MKCNFMISKEVTGSIIVIAEWEYSHDKNLDRIYFFIFCNI